MTTTKNIHYQCQCHCHTFYEMKLLWGVVKNICKIICNSLMLAKGYPGPNTLPPPVRYR